MAEQRRHPYERPRMEQKSRKDRIRQGVAAFLTSIIITLIILNTRTRNTDGRKQGKPATRHQQEQCTCRRAKDQHEGTRKQFNRDDKEDSRSRTTIAASGKDRTNKRQQPIKAVDRQVQPGLHHQPLQRIGHPHGSKTRTTQGQAKAQQKGNINHRHRHHNHGHRHRKRSSRQHHQDSIRDQQRG
jgi:hypothetical protein